MPWNGPLKKITEYKYEIEPTYKKGMHVSGIVYADAKMIEDVRKDNSLEQVANVATLPGIIGHSMAMPDIHWGYGFPIGGVAAFDYDTGIISPGGVGYDINCGVRLVRTNLHLKDVQPKIKELIDTIFTNVPSGVGSEGKLKLTYDEMKNVLDLGAEWAVEKGYGWHNDLEFLEENGRLASADSSFVSDKAIQRGMPQLGTLGAGNHFLEVQKVEEIYEPEIARIFGITAKDQIVVMIHTGSRGAGHQIATDYIAKMANAARKYNIHLEDKQLACAPVNSPEGEEYLKAMACGANYAWANRQLILHWVRESFQKVFKNSAEALDMHVIYDVCHNIGKIEEHEIEGRRRKVVVHRKGATRAFAMERREIPLPYRKIGQPVLIPGDMGTSSYLLVGTELAMKETFGSTCHGAGRVMSREAAIRRFRPNEVKEALMKQGIYVRAASKDVLSEESPEAYKDVDDVVRIAHNAGISRMIVKMRPIGVMKG
ncbi:MAG: RtcB family protein [Thermoplasmata archaeon]